MIIPAAISAPKNLIIGDINNNTAKLTVNGILSRVNELRAGGNDHDGPNTGPYVENSGSITANRFDIGTLGNGVLTNTIDGIITVRDDFHADGTVDNSGGACCV